MLWFFCLLFSCLLIKNFYVSLIFVGMMHSTVKQISVVNGHDWVIFAHSAVILHDAPGLRDNFAAVTF